MITFEETRQVLDELAEGLPEEIFDGLNGGIILVPETVRHQENPDRLLILGRYHYEPAGLGRYITIYYGSFCSLYGNAPREAQVEELRKVLYHELTHHIEALAGDKSLEYWDARQMEGFKQRFEEN